MVGDVVGGLLVTVGAVGLGFELSVNRRDVAWLYSKTYIVCLKNNFSLMIGGEGQNIVNVKVFYIISIKI